MGSEMCIRDRPGMTRTWVELSSTSAGGVRVSCSPTSSTVCSSLVDDPSIAPNHLRKATGAGRVHQFMCASAGRSAPLARLSAMSSAVCFPLGASANPCPVVDMDSRTMRSMSRCWRASAACVLNLLRRNLGTRGRESHHERRSSGARLLRKSSDHGLFNWLSHTFGCAAPQPMIPATRFGCREANVHATHVPNPWQTSSAVECPNERIDEAMSWAASNGS